MANKLILSEDASNKIEQLSKKLGLRRNIICRLAIGLSLKLDKSVENWETKDGNGLEFNRYTLTGDIDKIFKALVIQHEEEKLKDDVFFSEHLKKHIERGVEEVFKKFLKSSSEINFFERLIR